MNLNILDMETRNIVTYIRTATNDEKSVEAQRLQLNEYVAELSDDVYTTTLKEYVDMGYSGLSSDRPGLEAILSLAKSGEIDVLVTTDAERLHRNVTKVQELISNLDDQGVIVEFTKTSSLLSEAGEDVDTDFMERLNVAFAEHESEALSERIKAGIKRKKEAGNNQN
jgi:DNA invertase Pin-like site-specific DNA recombinase